MNPGQALLGSLIAFLFLVQLAVAVPPFLFDGYGSEGKILLSHIFSLFILFLVMLLLIAYIKINVLGESQGTMLLPHKFPFVKITRDTTNQ